MHEFYHVQAKWLVHLWGLYSDFSILHLDPHLLTKILHQTVTVFHECRRSKAGYLFCCDTSQQFQAESLCSDSLFWVNLGVQVLVKHLLHLTFFFCTLGVVNSEISKLLARKASTSSSFWICCCSSDVQYTSTSPDFSTVSKVSDWSLEGTGPTSCFSDFPWPYSPYHFTNKIHTYFIV